MKHLEHFRDFLNDTVNLNSTRLDDLTSSVEAIKNFVNKSDWEPTVIQWYPHGSWAHQTIIKPVDQGEFDADLIVFVDEVDGWSAAKYINSLYDVFDTSDLYKPKVKKWEYCVTINYVNEKKIDIAPCIKINGKNSKYEVCNAKSDTFEVTAPIDFTDWLKAKNTSTGGNQFKKVTRLFKYLRDIKTRFSCSSIHLTTMLGHLVRDEGENANEFCDLPTSFRTIMTRLDDWLQENESKPKVSNPFVDEDYSIEWSQDQYENFRKCIHRYRGWTDNAFEATDKDESILAWRRLFGDKFAPSEEVSKSISVSVIAESFLSTLDLAKNFAGDIVDAVVAFGVRAIPPSILEVPHAKNPPWSSETNRLPVAVNVSLYDKNDNLIKKVNSGDVVSKNAKLKFQAMTNTGTPFPRDFDVKWRVTNTGVEARDCLRGDFYPSEPNCIRWEDTAYRGVHFVEAFIIRKSSNALIGKSDPFYVVIDSALMG